MKKLLLKKTNSQSAFTLIEMLTVIVIIGLLAGLVSGLVGITGKKNKLTRTTTELNALKSAIETYKAKKGFYPPDNPLDSASNQLYYELVGCIAQGGNTFVTLDGQDTVTKATLQTLPGGKVEGIVNSCVTSNKNDDGYNVEAFLKDATSTKIQTISVAGNSFKLLAVTVDGVGATPNFNLWHYVSSHATNNPDGFDLWAEIVVAGRTNTICNWSAQPIARP
jgi:prepilin-type N-terminal cleavage/methylation domain-containing protein